MITAFVYTFLSLIFYISIFSSSFIFLVILYFSSVNYRIIPRRNDGNLYLQGRLLFSTLRGGGLPPAPINNGHLSHLGIVTLITKWCHLHQQGKITPTTWGRFRSPRLSWEGYINSLGKVIPSPWDSQQTSFWYNMHDCITIYYAFSEWY